MIDTIFEELRIEFTKSTDVPAHFCATNLAVPWEGAMTPREWISALSPKPLSNKALSIGGGG